MSGFFSPRGDLEGGDFPSTRLQRILVAVVAVALLGVLVYLGLR